MYEGYEQYLEPAYGVDPRMSSRSPQAVAHPTAAQEPKSGIDGVVLAAGLWSGLVAASVGGVVAPKVGVPWWLGAIIAWPVGSWTGSLTAKKLLSDRK